MQAIPLHGKRAAGRVALVDDADYQLVSGYRWRVSVIARSNLIYAQTLQGSGSNRRHIRMHTLILGQRGVDHVNGDGLDNRRANLRPATQAQNMANQGPRNGSSRYKGVSWHRRIGRWQAYITVAYRRRHLGYFTDETEAARAYDAAAHEAFGPFARPNFPEGT